MSKKSSLQQTGWSAAGQAAKARPGWDEHSASDLPRIQYQKDPYGVYGVVEGAYDKYHIRLQAGVGYIYTSECDLLRIVDEPAANAQAVLNICRQLCATMCRTNAIKLKFTRARTTGDVVQMNGSIALTPPMPGESEFTALGQKDNVYEVFSTPHGWQGQVSVIVNAGELTHQELFEGPQPRLGRVLEQCYAHETKSLLQNKTATAENRPGPER